MQDIIDCLKDEPNVVYKLSNTIVKYANMNEKDLEEQINIINKSLRQTEKEKQLFVNIYKSQDCSNLIDISEDGTIRTNDENSFMIENEFLKEEIFSKIYFQGKQDSSNDKFKEKVKNFFIGGKTDFKFKDNTKDNFLARKKVFSAMKITAREGGYIVLNSLDECESGDNIKIQAIKKGELNFNGLENICEKFETFHKDDDATELGIKDRITGKEITDPYIQTVGRFASIWLAAAGVKSINGEKIDGITYAFNKSSERIYYKLGELVKKSLNETGTIDTKFICKEMVDDDYSYSEEIVERLLSKSGNIKILYDFYHIRNDRLETILPKAILPNTGKKISYENLYAKEKSEDIINQLYNKNQLGNISMDNIKSSISRGQVTMHESKNARKSMKDLAKIKKLQDMQRNGQILTPEQKRLLDEYTQKKENWQSWIVNQSEQDQEISDL